MCVYIDKAEKGLLENNGFPCESTSGDENYNYKTRVNVDDFGIFLKLVKKHLGSMTKRKKIMYYNEL